MTLPTNLFVDAPEANDPSMQALSESVDEWPEEIIQKMKERIPNANPMSIICKFMKKDDEVGTATGSLQVSDAKQSAVVPIIIKDFMLYPMDVFIGNNKLLPLTPDYFDSFFSNNDPFMKLDEYPNYGGLGRFDDGNMWNAIYPPSLGRYSYASAGFPIIDSISSNLDTKEFVEYLRKNPADLIRFEKNGHKEIISKLAHLRPVNMNEFRQGADNLLHRNIYMLKKDGPNKYTILSNSDEVFSPVIKHVSGQAELGNFTAAISDCAHDDINDVDQNGEKLLLAPTSYGVDPYLDGPQTFTAEMANEFDHYVVKKQSGVEVEGLVIPKVISFDMKETGQKLFLGKTWSTVQDNIAGVRVKNSSFRLQKHDMAPGQTGTLVHMSGKSKALATVPFTIVAMTIGCCGGADITAQDLVGAPFKFKMTDTDFERIAPGADGYIVPGKKFFWVPMDGFQEVSNSPVDFAVKTAAFQKTSNPVKLLSTGFGQYALKGVEKYASALNWDVSNLSKVQTEFILASMGMRKFAAAFKVANASGQVTIHGLNRPATKSEKVASAIPMVKYLTKAAATLKSNLTKAASYIENSQNVDSLLSLNFINPDNIMKFVSKIPALKSSISHLASLLIASRLGVKELPEEAVSSAMNRLVEVIKGLETLRSTQER